MPETKKNERKELERWLIQNHFSTEEAKIYVRTLEGKMPTATSSRKRCKIATNNSRRLV